MELYFTQEGNENPTRGGTRTSSLRHHKPSTGSNQGPMRSGGVNNGGGSGVPAGSSVLSSGPRYNAVTFHAYNSWLYCLCNTPLQFRFLDVVREWPNDSIRSWPFRHAFHIRPQKIQLGSDWTLSQIRPTRCLLPWETTAGETRIKRLDHSRPDVSFLFHFKLFIGRLLLRSFSPTNRSRRSEG